MDKERDSPRTGSGSEKPKFDKPVVYPPVVIAHITSNITDLFVNKMQRKEEIQLHYSAQMNSHPHMGTVMSLMTAFSLGQRLEERFKVPISLRFEVLENVPGEQKKVDGITYAKMRCDTMVNGVPETDIYLKSFKDMLNTLKEYSGVEYNLLYYKEFQALPFVRKTLLKIIDGEKEFIPIIAPSEDHLRVRFNCPSCDWQEKEGKTTRIKEKSGDGSLTLTSRCFEHGEHQVVLAVNNNDFVDMNTPLRNVIKEALFIEEAKARKGLSLMVDGGDWVHMATYIVNEGLSRLGYTYEDMSARLFTPIIEDWSGAKFSKSVYVAKGTYEYLPQSFLNLVEFKEQYGNEGVTTLWNEVHSWTSDPKKLFRNYSSEYIAQLLRKQ